MNHRVAIVGAYGSGKTTLCNALSDITGLPRTQGSPMQDPVGGEGVDRQKWTPAQLVQLTVKRFAERVRNESHCTSGFLSDGSALHEWVFAKLRLVTGSYPDSAAGLALRDRAPDTALVEEVLDSIGLLMKQHAKAEYSAFLYVPIEFAMTEPNPPINENFRRISDEVLLGALDELGLPYTTVGGTVEERVEKSLHATGLDRIN